MALEVETGIAGGFQAIFSVIIQAVGGVLVGLVDAYVTYTRTSTLPKLGVIATTLLLAMILGQWHKSAKDRQTKSAWIINIFYKITRVFFWMSMLAVLARGISETLIKNFFYAGLVVVFACDFGIKRLYDRLSSSVSERAGRYGDLSEKPSLVERGAKEIWNRIKENKEEKTEDQRVNLLAATLDAVNKGIKAAEDAKIYYHKKERRIINLDKEKILIGTPKYPTTERVAQQGYTREALSFIKNQLYLLEDQFVYKKLIAFATITDKTKQKEFIKDLPHKSSIYKGLDKEIMNEEDIIKFTKELSKNLKELAEILSYKFDKKDVPQKKDKNLTSMYIKLLNSRF